MSSTRSGHPLLVCLAAAVLASPVTARATADGPDFWQVNAAQDVVLRNAADEGAGKLATIPAGTGGLGNLGCEGQPSYEAWSKMSEAERAEAGEKAWCRVTYNGQVGWVRNRSLAEFDASSAPGFDCGQAGGEVENMICADPRLAYLDHTMNKVHAQAMDAASGLDAGSEQAAATLRAMQRGWIGGRNECWKSVEDKTGCVRSSYEQRITKLQVQWSLVNPRDTVRFRCEDNSGFVITFFEPPLLPGAAVEYGDNREAFVGTRTASGSRYDGSFGKFVWLKGDEATFLWDQNKPEVLCYAVSGG